MSKKAHIMRVGVKVLTDPYSNDLETKINKFLEYHSMKNVTISVTSFDQSGIELGARCYPESQFGLIYTALITYEYDWTQMKINEEISDILKFNAEKIESEVRRSIFATENEKIDLTKKMLNDFKESKEFLAKVKEITDKWESYDESTPS